MLKQVLCAAALLLSALVEAQPRRDLRSTTGLSLNNLGLQTTADLTWRWPLSESKNVLLADAHFTIGITDSFSPAYNRLGLWLEYSPLSILDLRFGVEPSYYFGSFSTVIDLPGYEANYSPAALLSLTDVRGPGFGGRAYFEPTIKLKVKSVIFASYADFELWKMMSGTENFFYESQRDTVIQSTGDFVVVGTSVLLREFPRRGPDQKITAGLVHDYIRVSGAPGNSRDALGLLAVVGLGDRRLGLERPSLIVKPFVYLRDPERLLKRDEAGVNVAFRFFVGQLTRE